LKKKIAFHTLGCKLNFSETSAISKQFPKEEFEVVDFQEEADFYVINSCSVTQVAERKTFDMAKRARRKNPQAKVTVMGCFSQIKPEALADAGTIDLILGNDDKYNLLEYLRHPESERAVEIHVANINKVKRLCLLIALATVPEAF